MIKQSSSSNNTINFNENWTPNSMVDWISDHKKIILGTFVSLLVLLIVAFRLISGRNANAEVDYIKAQALFTQLQQNEITNSDEANSALKQLDDIMNKHPDLHAKYDGAIAQSLLIEGDAKQATPFAENVFKRTQSDHLTLYQEFSQTSLLIGNGEYVEALQKAQQLNQTLETGNNQQTNPTLYLFNLIRLAMLHEQLGQRAEEAEVWTFVQKHLNQSDMNKKFNTVLQSGKSSFNQYISDRIKLSEKMKQS